VNESMVALRGRSPGRSGALDLQQGERERRFRAFVRRPHVCGSEIAERQPDCGRCKGNGASC